MSSYCFRLLYSYNQNIHFSENMAINQENEVDKSLYTSLKELGLLESEANLYLTSLKLGPATIASLATNLGIPRPNVYKAISGLEKHGLAKFSKKKRYARTFV